jgi:hypothetical protein
MEAIELDVIEIGIGRPGATNACAGPGMTSSEVGLELEPIDIGIYGPSTSMNAGAAPPVAASDSPAPDALIDAAAEPPESDSVAAHAATDNSSGASLLEGAEGPASLSHRVWKKCKVNTLALVGVFFTMAAFGLTTYFGFIGIELQEWSAHNDMLQACAAEMVSPSHRRT